MPRPLTEATAALLLGGGKSAGAQGTGAKQAGPPQILLFGGWDENDDARGETWVYTPPAPASPTGLQATAGNEQATLDWSPGPDSSPAGYNVYRSKDSFRDPAEATKVNDALVEDTTYTDTQVSNDTTYHYRVTAANEAGTESGPSNETTVTPVLPVELARFTAEVEDRKAHLRWQTASETGSAGFEVQRRGPGAEAWQTLAFVESKAPGGTTSDPEGFRDYQYVTDALSVGTHRFRLRQVDLDGSTDLSEVLRVRVRMEAALRLGAPRPNPVSERATLSFAVREKTRARVFLYDVLGQRVRTLYVGTPPPGESRRVRIDAGRLPSGTYVVRLEAGGQATTRRLTVVR